MLMNLCGGSVAEYDLLLKSDISVMLLMLENYVSLREEKK